MGDKTTISWTDATLNVFRGTAGRWACTRVSPGCDHCYAATLNRRFGGPDYAQPGTPPNDTLRLDEKALIRPLRWQKPRLVFLHSMTDTFHEDVPTEWLDKLFAVMGGTERHTYQVLTKRPRRMRDYLLDPETERRVRRIRFAMGTAVYNGTLAGSMEQEGSWPLRNVWLGTSIELDRYAWRATLLRETPAAVRFVSAEPLLGPLPSLELRADGPPCPSCDLTRYFERRADGGTDAVCDHCGRRGAWDHIPTPPPAIDWVITGGESGAGYRPLDLDWVRDLRDRCVAAGVAFFHKQNGGARPGGDAPLDGVLLHQFPAEHAVPASAR